jgi:hypothetical protein
MYSTRVSGFVRRSERPSHFGVLLSKKKIWIFFSVNSAFRRTLSPSSDVLFHDALTTEERICFVADPNRDGYLLPVG